MQIGGRTEKEMGALTGEGLDATSRSHRKHALSCMNAARLSLIQAVR